MFYQLFDLTSCNEYLQRSKLRQLASCFSNWQTLCRLWQEDLTWPRGSCGELESVPRRIEFIIIENLSRRYIFQDEKKTKKMSETGKTAGELKSRVLTDFRSRKKLINLNFNPRHAPWETKSSRKIATKLEKQPTKGKPFNNNLLSTVLFHDRTLDSKVK